MISSRAYMRLGGGVPCFLRLAVYVLQQLQQFKWIHGLMAPDARR